MELTEKGLKRALEKHILPNLLRENRRVEVYMRQQANALSKLNDRIVQLENEVFWLLDRKKGSQNWCDCTRNENTDD